MMKPRRATLSILLLISILLSACSSKDVQQVSRLFPSIAQGDPTKTPFQPVGPTPTKTMAPAPTLPPVTDLIIYLDPSLPAALREQIHLPAGVRQAQTLLDANLQVGPLHGSGEWQTTWVYALVTPFPSLVDDISLDEIQRAWRGEPGETFTSPLLLSESTRAAFESRWGPPAGDRLKVMDETQILDEAWANQPAWALIPFESIEPRWKVLHVNGLSLFDKGLSLDQYPLTIWFGVSGQPKTVDLLRQNMSGSSTALFPVSNRDTNQMTVLVMTGVTALARATGYKMDTKGVTYPAQDIQDWLRNADLTHISNEVSFNTDCPKANFADTSTMFCSRPEYIELLDFIGADVIELSGNHNNDWGREADTYSLDLYKQRGWATFAGGANLEAARQPAKIENNGNKLAFIGCNPAGPPGAWATADEPGAAPCEDYAWMGDTIRQLRSEGYLPIVTFQYYEVYTYGLSTHQERDFKAAVDAGAVIVSGSQAHFPQYMEFYNGSFIHYGLGNLFFDQMDIPVVGTRREFIDRHVFYAGKHIQTELLTALLEDYAKPRPMTQDERRSFLSDVFSAAGW